MVAETDHGAQYFYQKEDNTEEEGLEGDYEDQRHLLQLSIDRQSEQVQLMRKSNFLLKSKIDIISDLLQVQKEKHHDLKQELNRMLVDII